MKQQKFKRHRYFHFTTKFTHPKWFDLSLYRNWLDLLRCLQGVQAQRIDEGVVWHAGLLMTNHIHLLFSTQLYNEHSLILDLEKALKKELVISKNLFQRPLPCEPLYHLEHLKAAYKYIYRNPVEAGLVRKVENYQFSSLALLLNKERPSLSNPFIDPFQIIQNLPDRLRWLNTRTILTFEQSQFAFQFSPDKPGLGQNSAEI
jgi:putative transposase